MFRFLINDFDSKLNDDAIYNDITRAFINFDKNNTGGVFIVYDLGLWHGRRQGTAYKRSLNDAIMLCLQDYNMIYFNKKNTTLSLAAHHHDGVNCFKFYKIIKGKKYAIKYADIIRA